MAEIKSEPVWRSTKNPATYDYRCDAPGCPNKADTVHFWPYVTRCEKVVLACPDHDPGGYWCDIADLFDTKPHNMLDHIAKKGPGDSGGDAIAMWFDRVDEYRRAEAKVEAES
jgi:hypothetical protein